LSQENSKFFAGNGAIGYPILELTLTEFFTLIVTLIVRILDAIMGLRNSGTV